MFKAYRLYHKRSPRKSSISGKFGLYLRASSLNINNYHMAEFAYPIKDAPKVVKTVIKIIIAVFVFIILINIFRFFVIIDQGERGVLLEFGQAKAIFEPGLHFQIPIVHNVVIFDVRTKKDQVEAGAASKDLQLVQTTIALNYHPDPATIDKLYQEVGVDYETRVISPAIQESIKASTAKFTAEELITKRELVKEDTRQNLVERLDNYHVVIDDFSIVDFSFSAEFDAAIEAKQTAVQTALKAENDLRRIEIEAKQKIETAKAEAESIRIQAEALKQNADLIQLKAVERWNGILPNYVMGDSIPLLNLQ